MQRDLIESYIPSCVDCQRNKSQTVKVPGPLHPLPVPERRGSSVAIDFIGPLPLDEGKDNIISMTCRLGSDVRIVPSSINLTVEALATVFFNNWYCDNGLPEEIVCDRDKLFVSKFWSVFTKLAGIKVKMSTSFYPETDGSSERSNKTINQALRFHVERNQKGWVRALHRVRFDIMNSVNASTGFSGFQLRMGRSPKVMPLIMPGILPLELTGTTEAISAENVISRLAEDEAEACDNLLHTKVQQAHFSNVGRGPNNVFIVGDEVMLSTLHRRSQYKNKNEKRATKFFRVTMDLTK